MILLLVGRRRGVTPVTVCLLSGHIWALKQQSRAQGFLGTGKNTAAGWAGSSQKGWAGAESFLSVSAWIIHLKFLAETLFPCTACPLSGSAAVCNLGSSSKSLDNIIYSYNFNTNSWAVIYLFANPQLRALVRRHHKRQYSSLLGNQTINVHYSY